MSHNEEWQRLRLIALAVERDCVQLRTDTVKQLIEVGELKVAMEILLDNMIELGVRPSNALHSEIVGVAQVLGVEPKLWAALQAGN
jgi:hypothetical protein